MFSIRKTVKVLASTTVLSAVAATTATTVVAAPASADVTAQTSVQFAKPRLVGVFGSYLNISGGEVKVRYPDGTEGNPYSGSAVLQRRAPGSSTWKNVETDTSPGYLYFPSTTQFRGDAKYRVYYTGGTYEHSSYGTVTYPPATSPVTTVATLLDVSVVGRNRSGRLFAAFSAVPRGRYALKVETKRNGRWVRYARTATNARGRAVVRITRTSRRGVPYRAIFAGGKRFTTTVLPFTGTRY